MMNGQNGGNQGWGQGNSGGFGAVGGPQTGQAGAQKPFQGWGAQGNQGGFMNSGMANSQGQAQGR